jgi:hypothetical protein
MMLTAINKKRSMNAMTSMQVTPNSVLTFILPIGKTDVLAKNREKRKTPQANGEID